jgi:hypothetical protein
MEVCHDNTTSTFMQFIGVGQREYITNLKLKAASAVPGNACVTIYLPAGAGRYNKEAFSRPFKKTFGCTLPRRNIPEKVLRRMVEKNSQDIQSRKSIKKNSQTSRGKPHYHGANRIGVGLYRGGGVGKRFTAAKIVFP